jgi:hypothetical protein
LGILLREDQDDAALEEKLELLKLILESADFSELRSRSEKILRTGKRIEFIVKSTGVPGKYVFEIKTL